MSLWLVIVAVVAVDAVAAGALVLGRQHAPAGSWFGDSQRAVGAFAVTGTIFAVLVGFVFLLAFQSFQSARSNSQDEALAALALFSGAERFPPAQRDRLRGEVVCYGRAVVASEWPAMADGRSSPTVDGWLARMDATSGRFRPRGAAESDAVQNVADEIDALERGRRGRLAEASRVIPTTIWVLLLITGAVVIVLAIAFADPAERAAAQLGLVVAVATAVAAGLLIVDFLDLPYGDHSGAITPSAMRGALVTMAAQSPPANAPCDASGRPSAA